jgi:hypothetical protein
VGRDTSWDRRNRWNSSLHYMTMFVQRLVGRKKKAVLSNEVNFFLSVFALLTGWILSRFIIFSCVFEFLAFLAHIGRFLETRFNGWRFLFLIKMLKS